MHKTQEKNNHFVPVMSVAKAIQQSADAAKKKLERTKSTPTLPPETDEPTDPISEEDDPFAELEQNLKNYMDLLHQKQLEKSKKQYLALCQGFHELEQAQNNTHIKLDGFLPPPEASVSPPPRQYQQPHWSNKRRYPYYQQPYPNTPFKKPRFDQ